MSVRVTVAVVGLVLLSSVAALLFRVSNAPERIKARREIAQATCEKRGGKWVQLGRDEACVRP